MESTPPSQTDNWTFQRVMVSTLILVIVAFCFWLLFRFNQVVFMVFIAIVLGTVMRPLITWLYQRGLPRIMGIILIGILMLAFFIGFIFLLFPMIFAQGTTIAAAIPGYYQNLREWVVNNPNQMVAQLGEFLTPILPGLEPIQQTGQQVLASAEQALSYAATTTRFIFLTIAILLLSFHWVLDGSRTIQSMLLLVPKGSRESICELISAMETKVGYFIAGQGFLCFVIGTMQLIAYLLIGLPNALVLAIVAGVLEAVPMVGPLLGAIPAAIIALSIAPSKLLWVIVASLVIQQLENNFLSPRVMSKAVGVNPFVSLVAIFTFSSLYGIPGAIMAIPIAAIIQLLLNRFIFHPTATESEFPAGRDLASRLRYEAQDLAQDLRKQARIKKGGSALRVRQIDKVMDEIEGITTDLDALLAQVPPPEEVP